MSLFPAAVRRYSVSISRFPLLSHMQVFSRELLPVYRLKYLYNFFSYHFSGKTETTNTASTTRQIGMGNI